MDGLASGDGQINARRIESSPLPYLEKTLKKHQGRRWRRTLSAVYGRAIVGRIRTFVAEGARLARRWKLR